MNNDKFDEFVRLKKEAAQCLRQMGYSDKSTYEYQKTWNKLGAFMLSNNISEYNKDIGALFLTDLFKSGKPIKYRNSWIAGISRLDQFQLKGTIVRTRLPHQVKQYKFNGPLGKLIRDFLDFKKSDGRAVETIRQHRLRLSNLYDFCVPLSILPHEISLDLIIRFIKQLDTSTPAASAAMLCTLRQFLGFLHNQNILTKNIATKIPRYKYVNQSQLPSTYSVQEIEKLIASIERSSAVGKRDYAAILIATRLGVRASDIANLKFENFQWEKDIIRIKQQKTGKIVELPLMPDVGNAVIDYLKFGRPKFDDPHIFLRHRVPIARATGPMISSIAERVFRHSGIKTDGRRIGSHSLRHSLAQRMLEKRLNLPVISEVLGHNSTDSTMFYLRIDLQTLSMCALDVPNVNIKFYQRLL